MSRDFLVELGTEELPPKALRALEHAFAEGVVARLREASMAHGAVTSYATPRRLALLIRRLVLTQPDQQVVRRGPPRKIAFDASGAPTRAAQAFAASCGVTVDALGTERDAAGNEYLHWSGSRQGAPARELLPGIVQAALEALPIPRRMRWGALDVQFVRPVHWLVMLHGADHIVATMYGVDSGTSTRGHRFMAPGAIRVRSPATYARTLQQRGRVVASFDERLQAVRSQVEALAATLQGRAVLSDALLEEVTALVEWPVALAGQFDARFLELPREVLISTLQEHQRYFALEGADGRLMPWFITVSNIDSPEPALVRAGNERVIRPRLADAEFFWTQDRRLPLSARLERLESVTFQAQLGSQAGRSRRIEALAAEIARAAGGSAEDIAHATRAAQLCKCDLATALVGEFPELQGTMGRYYALADGEPAGVATAIGDHYLPRGAGDSLPATLAGDAVALSDKLDSLAGIFAIGQKPSGTRDPFALRRAAIGLLRIVLEHRLELDLTSMLDRAVRQQPLADVASRATSIADEVYEFIIERLRAQYLERGYASTGMFDAVLAVRPRSLLDFDARLRALVAFVGTPEGLSLAAANKRTANILKKSPAGADDLPGVADAALLQAPAEKELHRALSELAAPVELLIRDRSYAEALDRLAALRASVDGFFDSVLVNDPDAALRRNRLALLAQLRSLFAGIADLSRLPG